MRRPSAIMQKREAARMGPGLRQDNAGHGAAAPLPWGNSARSGPGPGYLGLLARNELEQDRDAFPGFRDASADRRHDIFRLRHPFAIPSERPRHRGVVA